MCQSMHTLSFCNSHIVEHSYQGESGQKAANDAMKEVIEKVGTTQLDLEKTLKACNKIHETAMDVDPAPSQRFVNELTNTSSLLEKGEHILTEVSWLSKFKKLKNGDEMTAENSKHLQRQAAELLKELVDTAKSLKALIPK